MFGDRETAGHAEIMLGVGSAGRSSSNKGSVTSGNMLKVLMVTISY